MKQCPCRKERFHPNGPSFRRTITEAPCPTREYSRTVPWTPAHWGQMKLLISEIEFLTPFFGDEFNVVYAGAAPGVHMPILAKMFESMHFILVDPAPSMIAKNDFSNIEVMTEFMTDQLALGLSKKYHDKILFISDVRIGSTNPREPHKEQQIRIQKDMKAQESWMNIMCPRSSMLKFRLPWNIGNGKTVYPEGKIFLPVYGKILTHEARLVVERGALDFRYDNRLYEGQMAYFNQVLRPALYPSEDHLSSPEVMKYIEGWSTRFPESGEQRAGKEGQSVQGEHKCYDCTAFQLVVARYLLEAGVYTKGELTYDVINTECDCIEKKLSGFVDVWERMRPKPGPGCSRQPRYVQSRRPNQRGSNDFCCNVYNDVDVCGAISVFGAEGQHHDHSRRLIEVSSRILDMVRDWIDDFDGLNFDDYAKGPDHLDYYTKGSGYHALLKLIQRSVDDIEYEDLKNALKSKVHTVLEYGRSIPHDATTFLIDNMWSAVRSAYNIQLRS